jgi:hypothetical protein
MSSERVSADVTSVSARRVERTRPAVASLGRGGVWTFDLVGRRDLFQVDVPSACTQVHFWAADARAGG